jgi:hypothetical protein
VPVCSQDSARLGTPDCPVRQASSGELATLGKTSVAYNCNSSDCPVVHRTVRWANGGQRNGQPPNPRATRGPLQRSAGGTGLFGVHRTVSGAPTAANLQRSDAPEKEGNRAPVTEPPKSLGPSTVVLVQQTSDNPVDVPESLDKFGIFFLTFPGTFYLSCRHYRTSEI